MITTHDRRLKAIRYVDRNAATPLEMFVGALEAACMRAVWAGKRTTKEIWLYVVDNYARTFAQREGADEPLSYTTVTTTVVRLMDKQLLDRSAERSAHGYAYTPAYSSEARFVRAAIALVIESLYDAAPDAAYAAMRGIVEDHA